MRSAAIRGYIIRLFVMRSVVMLCVLVGVIQMLDLLSNADDIMAGAGAGDGSIWRYLSLRAPQLVSDFLPFAVLLGSLITFAQLSQSSEVIVMRAAGLSGFQVVLPFCIAATGFALVLFLFHELVTVPASKELANWQDANYAMDRPVASDVRYDVWLTTPDSLFKAKAARQTGQRLVAEDVTLYTHDSGGALATITSAARAVHQDGEWVLVNGSVTDLATLETAPFSRRPWTTPLTPERLLESAVVPEHLALTAIPAVQAQLAAEGLASPDLKTIAWSRIAAPLACILMPLLGAISGFGVPRRGAMLSRLAAGMMFGFAYFVVENLLVAMGKLGAVPPPLAAFLPVMLFSIVGFLVLTFTEDSGT